MLSSSLLIVSLCFLFSFKSQICLRDAGPITDNTGQCLKSNEQNLENCCFVCPMPDLSGYTETCNSLYDLGFGSCTQTGALSAMRTTCTNNGGNPDGSGFSCLCNIGTNKSQSTAYVPTPTNMPTSTPTNNAIIIQSCTLLTFLLFVLSLFI